MRLSLILPLVNGHPTNADERLIIPAHGLARRPRVCGDGLDRALFVAVDRRLGEFEAESDPRGRGGE